MKPEVNAMLQKVKENLNNEVDFKRIQALRLPDPDLNLNPTTPDFKSMSIMEATQWCLERGYKTPKDIVSITGKAVASVYTAMWKIRNPKRVKSLARRAKKARELKIMLIKDATKDKAKPTTVKTKKPKIENGKYDDGMETPFLDALNRQRTRFDFLERSIATNDESELVAENRRLKILVEHYESILFKGGK